MKTFSLSTYFKMKLKKFLPKTNTMLVFFVVICIYSVYTFYDMKTDETETSIEEREEPVTDYFKAIRIRDVVTGTEKRNNEVEQTTRNYEKFMYQYQSIVKSLINSTWKMIRKTVRNPEKTSHLDVAASKSIHEREKREDRQIIANKAVLRVTRKHTTKKRLLNNRGIKKWKSNSKTKKNHDEKNNHHKIAKKQANKASKRNLTEKTNQHKIAKKQANKASKRDLTEKTDQRKISKTQANKALKRNLTENTDRHKIARTQEASKRDLNHYEKTNQHNIAKPQANIALNLNSDEADLMDIGVAKRICPIKQPHRVDIQMLSVIQNLDFTPYDGNNVYKSKWNQPSSADRDQVPEDRSYKPKLKVFLVPHSHVDAGWIRTFDSYYNDEAYNILKNMVKKLSANPTWKFIWAEMAFLARWWDNNATESEKDAFKKLLANGQVELVSGGWVMNDEAVSHWVSAATQLAAGQQWALRVLRYRPRAAWAIDPFGHSAAQALLLRAAGMTRALLHRVHYRLKKELATQRQLEFRWRQLWDGTGETEIFTHVLAFNGYDVPNTCGPVRKVCCQFDFRNIGCPTFISNMRNMTKEQIERSLSRASFTLVDQWQKKAELFKTRVIMVPLGDDIAYSRLVEWDTQFKAYEIFMDFINGYEQLNTEVKFGTVTDYFNAVEQELAPWFFPALSGDFFPYADKWNHYWSGYFTTRPFYKSLDRVLMAYVKAAEIITAIATTQLAVTPAMSARMSERVERARRGLAMFQHHDAITGTSKHFVMIDYGKRLLSAIQDSQSVVKQATYFLLGQPPAAQTRMFKSSFKSVLNIYFDIDDVWRNPTTLPQRLTMILTTIYPLKRVVVYNALAFQRTELITVFVNTHDVQVYDEQERSVLVQASPVVVCTNTNHNLRFTPHLYRITFPVTVRPLSLATYNVMLNRAGHLRKTPTYALVQTYNLEPTNLDEVFNLEESANSPTKELVLKAGDSSQLILTPLGLLKAIVDRNTSERFDVNMTFVQYTSKPHPGPNSGAYLFIPLGPAEPIQLETLNPEIVVTSGPYVTTAYVSLVARSAAQIFLAVSVLNNPSLLQSEVEISPTILLNRAAGDLELAMRLTTTIASKDVFFTDLNGIQMIKRVYLEKLSLQGNWYPLGGAAYIQDDDRRLTLLSSVPLGVASLQSGQIEVMLDRRTTRDDGRGLSESVMDNLRTKYTFKLIHERANYICQKGYPNNELYGQLTLGAHISQQMLLQPPVLLHYSPPPTKTPVPRFVSNTVLAAADVVVASFRTDVVAMMDNGSLVHGMGLTLQRVHLDDCYGNQHIIDDTYPIGDGQVKLTQIANISSEQVFESTLTFTTLGKRVVDDTIFLCPMDITSVFIMQ